MAFYGATTLTWAQAKARVAGVAGSSADADQLIMAGYSIEEALLFWESRRDWKYAVETATPITLVVDTVTYNLPAGFKKIYNVRLTGNNPRVLRYFEKREYDLRRPNQSAQGTVPYGYILLQGMDAATATLELVPSCGVADSMLILYHRRHTIPAGITSGTTGNDSDLVDFPHRFMPALLASAKSMYLANKGGENNRLDYWTNVAEAMFDKAVGEDEWTPDMPSSGFTPGVSAGSSVYDPNDVRPYLGEW